MKAPTDVCDTEEFVSEFLPVQQRMWKVYSTSATRFFIRSRESSVILVSKISE